MKDFLKKKLLVLVLMFSITFIFIPTHTARAGDGLGTFFSAVLTVAVVAVVIVQPELVGLTPVILAEVGGGVTSYLAIGGSWVLATTVAGVVGSSGALFTSMVACAEGVLCGGGGSSGAILFPVASSNACQAQVPLTFYIPNFNKSYEERIQYCTNVSTDPDTVVPSCTTLPLSAQRYESQDEDGSCINPNPSGSYIEIAGSGCNFIYPYEVSWYPSVRQSWVPTTIDETHNKIAIYRIAVPTSQFPIDASGQPIDNQAFTRWFTGISGYSNTTYNFGPGLVDAGYTDAFYGQNIGRLNVSSWSTQDPNSTPYEADITLLNKADSTEHLLGMVTYADACVGNICKITDSTNVPENSYILYVAKILGDYKGPTYTGCGNDECPLTYLPTSAKFLFANKDYPGREMATLPWIYAAGGSIGNTFLGPVKTDVAVCPPTPTPVDGSCGATHYSCFSAPASTNHVDGANSYTWSCPGTDGGTTASCSESKTTYSCNAASLPTNANAFPQGTLTANTDYTYSSNGTNPTGCGFNCLSGYTWNGSRCAAIVPGAISCGSNAKTYTIETAWPSSSAFCVNSVPQVQSGGVCQGGECYDYNGNYLSCSQISTQDECDYSLNNYGDGYWTAANINVPDPRFPADGATTNWSCGNGSTGTLVSCSASKAIGSCSAPLTQNVTVACDKNADGYSAVSGSVTRSQTKSAYPACTFGTPVTVDNSTYVSDNCVYPTPTGTLSMNPASCTVAANASTCTVLASWNTNSAPTPALVDRNVGTTLSQQAGSSGLTVWVAYPQTVFDLKNGSTVLNTKTVTASCAANTTWNGSVCMLNVCSDPLTQTVSVSCDKNADGYDAVSGAVTRSQTKSAYPACTFGTPVTVDNSTYVSDNCVYPSCANGALVSSYPNCNVCAADKVYVGGFCVVCDNGGCTNGSCNDGAINPKSCNVYTPTATLSASRDIVDRGQSVTLTWSSTHATGCTFVGSLGARDSSGTVSSGALTDNPSTFQIACSGAGGTSAPATASVTVLQPDVSISVDKTRVTSGTNSFVVTWSSSQVSSCAVSGPQLSSAETSGSQTISNITSQSVYTITCQTNGSPIKKSAVVNVTAAFQEF